MKLTPSHPLEYLGKEIKTPNPILDWSRPFEIFVERKIWKKQVWKFGNGILEHHSKTGVWFSWGLWAARFMMDGQDRCPKLLRLLALSGILGSLENISPCFRSTCLLLLIASLFSALFSFYHCSKYSLLKDLFCSPSERRLVITESWFSAICKTLTPYRSIRPQHLSCLRWNTNPFWWLTFLGTEASPERPQIYWFPAAAGKNHYQSTQGKLSCTGCLAQWTYFLEYSLN